MHTFAAVVYCRYRPVLTSVCSPHWLLWHSWTVTSQTSTLSHHLLQWHCSTQLNAGSDQSWKGQFEITWVVTKELYMLKWYGKNTNLLCCGLSIHCLNHVLVRFWHSVSPVRQAMRMTFSWLYLQKETSASDITSSDLQKQLKY